MSQRFVGSIALVSAIGLIFAAGLLVLPAIRSAEASILIVNSTADTGDALCDVAPGGCTLRDALTVANAGDTINFAISAATEPGCSPGTGVCVITLTAGLPIITDANVTINGYSQPGASENTLAVGSDAAIKLEIDMHLAAGSPAFRVNAAGVEIAGVAISHLDNGSPALEIQAGASAAMIRGNFIGLNAAGTTEDNTLNSSTGISIQQGSTGNLIGGSDPGDRNVTGGTQEGVIIRASTGNTILNNYIGTNAAGTAALPHSTGIFVEADDNLILGNLIAGSGIGIYIIDGDTNRVRGNIVGTGTLGNGTGVRVLGSDDTPTGNEIGGASAGDGNVISGNQTGVAVNRADGTVISRNLIGTDLAGGAAVANEIGVSVDEATNTMIGGGQYAARNIISGNGVGIEIERANSSTTIKRNYIGTNLAGNAAVPNADFGILATNSTDFGAGPTIIQLNVVSGNDGPGIAVTGVPGDTRIENNWIGINRELDTTLPNAEAGVIGHASGTNIGSATGAPGNVIAFNDGSGVWVPVLFDPFPSGPAAAPQGGAPLPFAGNVTILKNNIFSNADLGIDIGPAGHLANDNGTGDADVGPNGLQNAPVLTSAVVGSTKIAGTFDSTPTRDFRVEFFTSSTCDASTFGEGRVFAGASTLHTDADGAIVFLVESPVNAQVGDVVTATATDLTTGATSEFSNCMTVAAAPSPTATPNGQTPSPTPIPIETPGPTVAITEEPTPTPSPTPTSTPSSAPGTSAPATSQPPITPTPTPVPTGSDVLRQGDNDCSGQVAERDSLFVFLLLADLAQEGFDPCPSLASDMGFLWGDVDCDGDVDAGDGIAILQWLAGLDYEREQPCVEMGEVFAI